MKKNRTFFIFRAWRGSPAPVCFPDELIIIFTYNCKTLQSFQQSKALILYANDSIHWQ